MATTPGSSTVPPPPPPPPPQLIFDDGARIMGEDHHARQQQQQQQQLDETLDAVPGKRTNRRSDDVSLDEFYEVDRLADEILQMAQKLSQNDDTDQSKRRNGWMIRVALQFPDELLQDAPEVCWAFEQALQNKATRDAASSSAPPPLVFVLGDTTYAPCCPDHAAAAHLQADCLVHYGHACLSSKSSSQQEVLVLYSFGRYPMDAETCVEHVLEQVQAASQKQMPVDRLLLLYEVGYHHAMEDLQTTLSERGELLVVAGQIPWHATSPAALSYIKDHDNQTNKNRPNVDLATAAAADDTSRRPQTAASSTTSACCQRENGVNSCTKTTPPPITQTDPIPPPSMETQDVDQAAALEEDVYHVGGLELPANLDLSTFVVLFIGDDSSRQFLNIALRLISSSSSSSTLSSPPRQYWTWRPKESRLDTELSPAFQRQLNRRFYLIQKAKHCSVFGVLVTNLSDTQQTQTVIQAIRAMLQKHDRTSYAFVVGKINPAKLANFPEIECFVLVACPEHSLLDHDREYSVPIVTPLELSMALGVHEWGDLQYSLDSQDFLKAASSATDQDVEGDDKDNSDNDSDAPYFSLVTGRYESVPRSKTTTTGKELNGDADDLTRLPGQGQLSTYTSPAADFLKQREYQGLQVEEGETQVRAAIPGQHGIASNYENR